MNKLNTTQETILRKQIAVCQETIKECNAMLVAGGCEPEPESVLRDAKILASGAIEQTQRGFKNIISKIKAGYTETKQNMMVAGEERATRKEIDKQVEDRMKEVRDNLHAAVGVK